VGEISTLIHSRGKRLALSMWPSDNLESLTGGWVIDWRSLIRNKIIDEFKIEPRHNGEYEGLFDSIDAQFGYVAECKAAGVKLGFDFFANALAFDQLDPATLSDDPRKFFVENFVEIASWPVDYIGIYEGYQLDALNYWKYFSEAHKIIGERQKERKKVTTLGSKAASPHRINVGLAYAGATATLRMGGQLIDARPVNDGNPDETSYVTGTGVPFEVMIELNQPRQIELVRIYSGILSDSVNPSGPCGISEYRLEGRVQGKWEPLTPSIQRVPGLKESGSHLWIDYYSDFKLPSPIKVDGIKLIVLKSQDTGCRLQSPKEPMIPAEKRVTFIREIELLTSTELNKQKK
jgi:hypothetical protein